MSEILQAASGRARFAAYFLLTSGCLAFAFLAGKDLNWDLLNYHYYAGFAAVSGRLELDFFPASVQSYLSPYGYVPLYLLASAGVPDYAIALLLAGLSSTLLWGVWEMGGRLGGMVDGRQFSIQAAWCAAVLTGIAPLFFVQLGSSFIDMPSAVLVVWAYALLVWNRGFPDRTRLDLAALLLGLAVALKLTNVLYAFAAVVLVVLSPWTSFREQLKGAARLGLASAAVAALALLPWSYQLWANFGNPVFPFFNTIFASPDFPQVSIAHTRFVPDSFAEALALPFDLLRPERYVYTESVAPDARFAVLLVLLLLVPVAVALRRSRRAAVSPLVPFLAAFVVAWVAWLSVSGNGRYFAPMVAVASPLVVALVFALGSSKRFRVYLLGSLAAVQFAIGAIAAEARWGGTGWSGKFLDVDVPAALAKQPTLYLNTDIQTASFLVPFLHPASGFVNVNGHFPIGVGEAGWSRVESQLAKFGDSRTRALFMTGYVDEDGIGLPPPKERMAPILARMSLRVDVEDCEQIIVRGVGSTKIVRSDATKEIQFLPHDARVYLACSVVRDRDLGDQYTKESREVRETFRAVELRCPRLFAPVLETVEGGPSAWYRFYMNTDTALSIHKDRVRITRLGFTDEFVIGSVDDVRKGHFELDCGKRRIRQQLDAG